MPDYQEILQDIHGRTLAERPDGKVASYIPGLAEVPPEQFGIHLHTASGEDFSEGDSEVLLLAMLASSEGDHIWKRAGVRH